MEIIKVRSREREQLIEFTDEVRRRLKASGAREGVCVLYVQHTTAGLTINENADPDVPRDMLQHLRALIPQHGAGIDPEFLPHVFEHFRQADSTSTRKHGGLGLGLAIVRRLVELHGGTVAAESGGEGRGATFRIRLPLLRRTPRSSEADTGGGGGSRGKSARGR